MNAGVGTRDKMTIREELNRQVRWVYPMLFLGMILFLAGGLLTAYHVIAWPWPGIPAAVIFFGMFFFMNFAIKCPRCRKLLFGTTWVVGGKLFSVGKRMKFCPRCGVDFDSEMEMK